MNVDEAHIIVFAVRAPALRLIVILKPLCADNVTEAGKIPQSLLNDHRPLCLGWYRKEVPDVFVTTPVFPGGAEEFRNQNRFICKRRESFEEIMRHPPIRPVEIVVGRNYVDVRGHRSDGSLRIVNG